MAKKKEGYYTLQVKRRRTEMAQAARIMREEEQAGRKDSGTYRAAKETRDNLMEFMHKDSGRKPGHVSPGKKSPKGSKPNYEKRRRPFEKATGTGRIKEALIGVAKVGKKKSEE
jgi:hypothetical protein